MDQHTGIITPCDPTQLEGLEVAPDLEYYFDGDAARVVGMLGEVASSGRLAVAVADGSRIVGYCGALPPRPDDRLYPVVSAIELSVFEVARSHRRQGLFGSLFPALFERDLEDLIVYAVVDPVRREVPETPRAFRALAERVLGSVGMMPLPTDDPRVHRHRDATFFARIGRGVPTPDVELFFKTLRSSVRASVAITLGEPALRNLLRADLERGGFDVVGVRSMRTDTDADVLVTDQPSGCGRELTIRLDPDLAEPKMNNGTMRFPPSALDRLPEILRAELTNRRAHG